MLGRKSGLEEARIRGLEKLQIKRKKTDTQRLVSLSLRSLHHETHTILVECAFFPNSGILRFLTGPPRTRGVCRTCVTHVQDQN